MTKAKKTFAMDLAALMAVEQLASESKKSPEKILLSFMKSLTCQMLYDDSTKLWWDGPASIAAQFKQEKRS